MKCIVPNLSQLRNQLSQNAKKASRQATDLRIRGANGRTRTGDLRITSALLYQLSHVGIECFP